MIMGLCIVAFGVLAAQNAAWAMPYPNSSLGRCRLEVDGRVYISTRCNTVIYSDGSLCVGCVEGPSDPGRTKHFATVNLSPGTKSAIGSWNGRDADTHAHESLGNLRRHGACWVNRRAKICAWAN